MIYTYSLNRRKNNAYKLIRTVQFSCNYRLISKTILRVIDEDKAYTMIRHDAFSNTLDIQYHERLVIQNICIIIIKVDENITNVSVEVTNDDTNLVISNSHEKRIEFLVDKIALALE